MSTCGAIFIEFFRVLSIYGVPFNVGAPHAHYIANGSEHIE